MNTFILKNIGFILINKLYLLQKEAFNIKYSLSYIKCLYEINGENNENNENQLLNDINNIKEMNEEIIDRIKNIESEFKKLLNEKYSKYSLREIIILLDCIHNRINDSLIKKFEYVVVSYENLLLSSKYLYLPHISVTKAVKTSNLMIYFNKMLNDFFQKIINENKKNKFFSTWNFIYGDKVFELKEDIHYIEFSFWLYEMPIFHVIGMHEVFHVKYKNDFKSDSKKGWNKEDFEYINTSMGKQILSEINLSRDFFEKIYEELIVDLFCFNLFGESYLYSLFADGFMFKIYKNFCNIDFSDPSKNNCCLDQDILVYNFDFDKRSMQYIIRIFFLLKYYYNHNKTNVSNEFIDDIKKVIEFIFPPDKKDINEIDFEIYLDNFVQGYQYKKIKIAKDIIVDIMYNLFLKKDIFDIIEKEIKNFEKEETIKEIKKRYTTIFDEYKKELKEIKNFENFTKRIIEVNFKLQRFFRELNIGNSGGSEEDNIYYLTFVKFCRKGQDDPFIFYNNKDAFRSSKKKNLYAFGPNENAFGSSEKKYLYAFGPNENAFGSSEKKYLYAFGPYENAFGSSEKKYLYAFGPYDLAILDRKNINYFEKLNEDFDKKTFFIETHSLYLLYSKDIQIEDKEKKIYDIIFLIHVKNIFLNKDQFRNKVNELKEKIDEKLKDYKYKFYVSMGSEHIVIYVEELNESEVSDIINDIHNLENKYILHLSSNVFFNTNIKNEKNDDIDIKNISILVKFKMNKMNGENNNNNLNSLYEKFRENINKNIIDNTKIKIYKKLGIYDAIIQIDEIKLSDLKKLIEDISNITSDIQIEKRIEL